MRARAAAWVLAVAALVPVLCPALAAPPDEPLVVDAGGVPGGTLRMLIAKPRDIRYMTVHGYARLVGYDRDRHLGPDIALRVEVEDDRVFTFHLRHGHRWSDGHPFTSEDFRYFWEDVATNRELMPTGPPAQLVVDGEAPEVTILDETTVRYAWSRAHPGFLPALAGARPLMIYRPAHYLKQFHARYADARALSAAIDEANLRSWAPLHNRMDNMYRLDNPDMPTLQPWFNTTAPPAPRYVFKRNPHYHRVDRQGQALPYIDRVVLTVADTRLIPAKTATGDSDLQAAGLAFADAAVLKEGEERGGYELRLWRSSRGSQLALYPNLNVGDPVWRALLRDRRFRQALSLAIDRHLINQVMFFGLATEGNNTVLSASPLYREAYRTRNASYDPERANAFLDEMGLAGRDGEGIRLMPDGRPIDIVVETAGESSEQVDILQLIEDDWKRIGIRLFVKPSQRDILRNRVFAGRTVMSAWWGLDNAIPTPAMDPAPLAPTRQDNLAWPAWGQFHETKGAMGEAPAPGPAQELLTLADTWRAAPDDEERAEIWHRMLSIHAQETFSIGTVAEVRQPVVVSRHLRGVPQEAFYGWEPGAYFGVYRPDQFWLEPGATPASAGANSSAPADQKACGTGAC